jgi:hypothetical protein
MDKKKQTAVEWLEQAINNKLSNELSPYFIELFNQAIAMEKEQIIDAYRDGRSDQHSKVRIFYNRNAIYYYTSTYGK